MLRFRHRLLGVALCAAVAWLGCAPPVSPDVVLIVVDSLRADRLGAYGYAYATRGFDAFAEESLRFENVFAPSSRSAPSLASLFTARLPSRHGVERFGDALSGEAPTLAESFRDAGYQTVLVSGAAWLRDPQTGLARGFERVEPVGREGRDEATPPGTGREGREERGERDEQAEGARGPEGESFRERRERRAELRKRREEAAAAGEEEVLPPARREKERETELPPDAAPTPVSDPAQLWDGAVTRSALEVLNEPREAPLFLVIHWLGPHAPYDASDWARRGGTRRYDGRVDGSLEQLARAARGELALETLDRAHYSGLYDAEVQSVDKQLESVLGHLRRSGWLDDMLVVLTSDHGESLPLDGGGFFHGTTLRREQIQVPWLLHAPGGRGQGESVARAVSLLDVGPTLLDLAGLPGLSRVDGVSRVGLAGADDPNQSDRPVRSELAPDPTWASVWGRERHRAAVVTERWSLLAGASSGAGGSREGSFELYDRAADPQQLTDVASQHPDVVQELSAALSE